MEAPAFDGIAASFAPKSLYIFLVRNLWQRDLAELFPTAKLDEPLSKHTTFRIGGPADAYIVVHSIEDLKRLYHFVRTHSLPVFLLGFGSNLLVLDGGIRGVVVRMRGDFEKIYFLEDKDVWAGSGVRLPQLVLRCAQRGLAGAESLVGVPGTVGGSLVMNAGTREGEIGDLVQEVDTFDPRTLKTMRLQKARLHFRYRQSSLEGRILLGARLKLKQGDKVDIIRRVRKFQQKRLQTQPIHSFNVGSIFKNPPGHFVAKLIQEAGLKGEVFGGARISLLHANFIENANRATAQDVLRLVQRASSAVLSRTGIQLELEMRVVGEKAPNPA